MNDSFAQQKSMDLNNITTKKDTGIKFDHVQAKKWLAQAGYPEGKGFPEITLMYNKSETHEKIARAVRLLLKHYLNIDVKLQAKDQDSSTGATGEPPQIFQTKWCGDFPNADSWLSILQSYSSFYSSWKSKEFTELIDKAVKAPDRYQRTKFYKLAEQILCEKDVSVIPLYFEIAHCLVKPRVKGWYHMPIGGQHIRNWYFEEK